MMGLTRCQSAMIITQFVAAIHPFFLEIFFYSSPIRPASANGVAYFPVLFRSTFNTKFDYNWTTCYGRYGYVVGCVLKCSFCSSSQRHGLSSALSNDRRMCIKHIYPAHGELFAEKARLLKQRIRIIQLKKVPGQYLHPL